MNNEAVNRPLHTSINKQYGLCLCFRCRDIKISDRDVEWSDRTVARHWLRKSKDEFIKLKFEFEVRHGSDATNKMQRAINFERKLIR